MPLYEYECTKCHEHFDVFHAADQRKRPRCPKCGSSSRRVFLPVGIIFKGSGFHVNDYGRGNGGRNGDKQKKSEEAVEKTKETSKAETPKAETSKEG